MSNSAVHPAEDECVNYCYRTSNFKISVVQNSKHLFLTHKFVGWLEWLCSTRLILILGQQASWDTFFSKQWRRHASPTARHILCPCLHYICQLPESWGCTVVLLIKALGSSEEKNRNRPMHVSTAVVHSPFRRLLGDRVN